MLTLSLPLSFLKFSDIFYEETKKGFLLSINQEPNIVFYPSADTKKQNIPWGKRVKVSTDTTRAVVQTRHSEGLKRAVGSNVTDANRQLTATGLKLNGAGLECLNRSETLRTVFAGFTCLIRAPYRQKHYSVYVTVTHCYPR